MKFKGLVFALGMCLTILGCGGGGSGSSTNIFLRTVVLVHPAAVSGTFGSDDYTITGSQTGNIVISVSAPVVTGFNITTATLQSFTAVDVTASPNITLGSTSQSATTASAFYTLYVTGLEGSSTNPPAVGIVQESPPQASTTAALVRFGNFSTSAGGAVDVYFTTTNSGALSGTPNISGAGYGTPGNYVSLPGGNYYIRICPTGQPGTVLFTSGQFTFINGFYYSNFGWDTAANTPYVLTYQDVY